MRYQKASAMNTTLATPPTTPPTIAPVLLDDADEVCEGAAGGLEDEDCGEAFVEVEVAVEAGGVVDMSLPSTR